MADAPVLEVELFALAPARFDAVLEIPLPLPAVLPAWWSVCLALTSAVLSPAAAAVCCNRVVWPAVVAVALESAASSVEAVVEAEVEGSSDGAVRLSVALALASVVSPSLRAETVRAAVAEEVVEGVDVEADAVDRGADGGPVSV
jgi:hypothetical protein